MGILKERKEDIGGWSQYTYQITEEGKKWADECKEERLYGIEGIVATLNNKSARELELIATILYFRDLPKDEIIQKIYDLKSDKNYSALEIDEAFRFIKEKCYMEIK